ncbi:hypothetical protein GLP59_19200 [Sulfitobacter sp. M220]|nr:hypothetical protein [Sulfitobacter sp. M220]MCF7779703.1 hypothetical protein [Sulfitobacter sp. M220]
MTPASVTDLPSIFDGIEAVCFDAFGTLVEMRFIFLRLGQRTMAKLTG